MTLNNRLDGIKRVKPRDTFEMKLTQNYYLLTPFFSKFKTKKTKTKQFTLRLVVFDTMGLGFGTMYIFEKGIRSENCLGGQHAAIMYEGQLVLLFQAYPKILIIYIVSVKQNHGTVVSASDS